MSEFILLISITLVGILSGFIGSVISGATTSLAVPLMIALGVPPQLAISNRQFGVLSWRIGGIHQYFKAGKIVWHYVLPLTIVGSIGAFIGTKLLMSANDSFLQIAAAIISLLLLPVLYKDKKRGTVKSQPNRVVKVVSYCMYIVVSALSSLIAVGAGVLMTYLYLYGFKLTLLEIKGTDRIAGLLPNVVSVFALLFYGLYNLPQALMLAIGMFIGAWFGSKYAIKIGDEKLRNFTFVSILAASLLLIITALT